MRSISFGPTSYFESSLNNQQVSQQDQPENLIRQTSQERIPQQNAYFQQQAISSLQRLQANNDVVFYSCDDLFRESLVGHKELAMKKNCKCRFTFDSQRTFQSYCNEFCGLLNIQASDVKFFTKNKEVPMLRVIRKPCVIEVYYHSQSTKYELNSLKPAFNELLNKGIYSDIDIVIKGETIKAHKCILVARSEKFRVMLQNHMKESIENKIEINNEDANPSIYKLLIQWIYEGECDLPDSLRDLISLLILTDEYLLPDLQKVCEEQIIDQIDCQGAVEILTDTNLIFPQTSEQPIKEAAKTALLDDYEKVEMLFPDIEERISKVKGLMSELFTHKKKKRQSNRRRKGSIIGDDSQKKKVRFNISNTIYEEASAIYDETDSLIEPLSIYSNSSPPGELNDDIMVSSTHSSIHAALSEQRRHSGPSSTHAQYSGVLSNIQENSYSGFNEQARHLAVTTNHGNHNGVISPAGRLMRPASAGRGDNSHHHHGFRGSSSISLQGGNLSENRTQENGASDQNSLYNRHSDRFNSLI